MEPAPDTRADLAVVGAGAAGLYTALCAARAGARVALVSATPLAGTSSYWAQGGLAAALAPGDSPEGHLGDTVRAGRGAVRVSAAQILCEGAAQAVADLEALGVRFDADPGGGRSLAREGGHSARRVVHAGGSATGRRIADRLSELVGAHPRIEVLELCRAVALELRDGRCCGVVGHDGRRVQARAVALATGGAAALWERTTNPPGAIGDGLLLAHAAGAALADLELVQFHPTAVVHHDGADGFLVTEAVRGEGARLLDDTGERFVDEMAPRDEVARAVCDAMRRSGAPAVGLDMREVDLGRFPNVVGFLRGAGIDPARELVPVAPAAHYVMGGIVADLDGRTGVPGLLAVGECACTGLHGANRLASNSLSECFVFGRRVAAAALAGQDARPRGPAEIARPDPAPAGRASRTALWELAGLERDGDGLRRLLGDPHPLVRLVGRCALARAESRGGHLRRDHPEPDPALDLAHVVLRPGAEPAIERWS